MGVTAAPNTQTVQQGVDPDSVRIGKDVIEILTKQNT